MRAADSSFLNAEFLVFNTQFFVFKTEFLVLNNEIPRFKYKQFLITALHPPSSNTALATAASLPQMEK